jgi:hypothetical protein
MRTTEQLRAIATERRTWAKEARDKDLHGSAKEWELLAEICDQSIDSIERAALVAENFHRQLEPPGDNAARDMTRKIGRLIAAEIRNHGATS